MTPTEELSIPDEDRHAPVHSGPNSLQWGEAPWGGASPEVWGESSGEDQVSLLETKQRKRTRGGKGGKGPRRAVWGFIVTQCPGIKVEAAKDV